MRRFADAHIRPHAERWEEEASFDADLYRLGGAAGILGPAHPEALGGGGGDVLHTLVACQELIRGGSTGVAVGLGSLEIALPPILSLGTPEQQARLVPPVLRGEAVAALAITEPGAGSDVAGVRLKAERDGGGWRLTGAKTFITSGVRADLVVTLARTGPDPHGGLTFFAVRKGTPGFSVSRALKKTGWWPSDTAELHFDNAFVPDEDRVGPEGSGFVALMQNFETERLMLAVQGCAIARIAWEEARAYAAQREAFGRPIGKFQVTRHKLADMATRLLAAEALTFAVAARMRAGEHPVAEVAMAKNLAADAAVSVCYDAVQIFGGMGYMRETRVERLSRDARLLPIGGGTSEVMNEIIAKMIL